MLDKTKTKVITGWDNWNDNSITLVVKEEGQTKERVLKEVDWYFAITKEDFERINGKEFFHSFNGRIYEKLVYQLKAKGEYVLVYCRNTVREGLTEKLISELNKLAVKVYEADVSRTQRYLVDNDIQIAEDLNILYFDIETDDSNIGIKVGRDRILSWAAFDEKGNHFFECLDDEKKLLEKFLELLNNYDVFTGWNSEKFDLPYIQARMEKYRLSYNWKKKIHLDMMKRCIKVYSYEMDKIGLTGFSLNEFARVFLDEKKVEFEDRIIDLFNNDREKLKEYNVHDSRLLYMLDKKLEIIKLMIASCSMTGALLNRFYVGELLDCYMLRRSKERNLYLSTKPLQEQIDDNFNTHIIGGYVKEPTVGVYEDVRIFDFKSLYPSIIVSWNISADSLNINKSLKGDIAFRKFTETEKIEDIDFARWFKFLKEQKALLDPSDECYQTANNNFFRKDKEGFISALIGDLLKSRVMYKNKMKDFKPGTAQYSHLRSSQATIKELANSMYGVTGDRRSRYFNKNIAESITITGQFLNRLASAILEKRGYPAIYGDTDSVFSPIPEIDNPVKVGEDVNKKLVEFVKTQFSLPSTTIELEYEKAYRKMIMVDKKRYSGTMKWVEGKDTDILYSKGLEDVKKNTIALTRKKMRELIVMITKDNKSLKEVKDWLLELREYVFNVKDIDKNEISISTRVSKPTYKYKVKSAHVLLAEKLIKRGLILQPSEDSDSWGTRITYIIKTTNPSQEAVYIDDFDGEWDREYYWDTQVYAPIFRILQIAWPSEDWIQYSITESKMRERRLKREQKQKEKEELEKLKEKQLKLNL